MNIKKFKPLFWAYNLLNFRLLLHNRQAYRKYHLHKPLIASLSSKDFPDKESRAWLDLKDAATVVDTKPVFQSFDKQLQEGLRSWSSNGYLVLSQFFDPSACDAIQAEVESLVEKGKVGFREGNKLMFANRRSAMIRNSTTHHGLLSILSFILDKEVVPFQTINFMQGSEQRAHSDSIHMTTYPLGYLIAAWIALEDVDQNNGPLFYYPGSHRLPYLLNNSFNEGESFLILGKRNYSDYENAIDEEIRRHGFQKKEFHAKKGDVFIWHANLLHGGSPILDKGRTRKSMVIHYFAKDVIKYHEITERPSLLDE